MLTLFLTIIVVITLFVDLTQTLHIKNLSELHEINPILGEHPSDFKIWIYFLIWIGIFILGFLYAPTVLFIISCLLVEALEIYTIRNNLKLGMGW